MNFVLIYNQESYFTYTEGEQSDVDHDVHFRPGVGADGSETYTPRTVIYDLKGGFGTLRRYNALYELSEDSTAGQGLWYASRIGRHVLQINIWQGWSRDSAETNSNSTKRISEKLGSGNYSTSPDLRVCTLLVRLQQGVLSPEVHCSAK